ncbi:MAG: hypothetical protein ACE15F_04325 [bacterium]
MGTVRLILMGSACLVLTGCAGTGKVPEWDDYPDRPQFRFAAREELDYPARMGILVPFLELESGGTEGVDPRDARG